MIIRSAYEADAPVLSALARDAKAHWPYSSEQLAIWRADLEILPAAIATFPTFIAEINGEVAGFCLLEPAPANWALEHLWVSPSHMRQGIGRTLLFHAIDFAAKQGATALAIDADPNAEAFYEACGARRVGSIPAPIKESPNRERPQMLLRIATAELGEGEGAA